MNDDPTRSGGEAIVGLFLIVVALLGGFLLLALICGGIYELVKWMRYKFTSPHKNADECEPMDTYGPDTSQD